MGSVGVTQNDMNVPYDEWGPEISIQSHKDKDGNNYYIQDEYRRELEPEHRTITKKYALDDVEAWKNDDGTYGTGDEAIYIAYEDGKFLNLTDGDTHRRWSKQGISGISISTGDYQVVWGGEWIRKPYQQPVFEKYTTSEWDSDSNPVDGYSNSYSGYRTAAMWKVRVKTSYPYNEKTGKYETKREILRQSAKKYY